MRKSGLAMLYRKGLVLLLCLMVGLAVGCSDGDDDAVPVVREGRFVDSLVVGLAYQTPTRSGVTGDDGRFEYLEGETVTFSIGGIVLGDAPGSDIITPVDLVDDAEDENHPAVTNITRFLLTLDNDADPEDGVMITPEVRTAAVNMSLNFSLGITAFEEAPEVQQVVASLTMLTIAGQRGLIAVSIAQVHLSLTLARLDDYMDDDGDGSAEVDGDCNDDDSSVYSGADDICEDGIDQDCDGADAVCPSDPDVDDDGDGVTENEGDCEDAAADVFPGAEEVCDDGIDQDCDGEDLVCLDVDADGDGFSAAGGGDCNDDDGSIYPGAAEVCGDGIDQNCDGVDLVCAVEDADSDGFTVADGDCNDEDAAVYPGAEEVCGDGIDQDCDGVDLVCTVEDADSDGVTVADGDCNDEDAAVYPGAEEVCGDGIDQNCDGADLSCEDADNDSDGVTENEGDCDDANEAVFPGATEICGDGIDQDCDGSDLVCAGPGPLDTDNDGDGYTENQGDCNDGAFGIHPGSAEICGDGIDQNCNGSDLVCANPDETDDDGDGYTENQGDCDDTAAGVFPGAAEICDDGTDQDCNGTDLSCDDADSDSDGYSVNQGDCNDVNSRIYPGAAEICGDGIDQDCDGTDLVCTEEGTLLLNGGVEGVQYETETQSGVTDENGRFRYLAGETVIFFIGQIVLGDAPAENVITPVDLVDGGNATSPAVINITRLLMTLDDDDDASDGIQISYLVRISAGMNIDFNLGPDAFAEDIRDVIYLLTAFRETGRRLLVFAFHAQFYIDITIDTESMFDTDADNDGYTIGDGDCDDDNADIHPGAEEICGDEIDQNCDGSDSCTLESTILSNGYRITFLDVRRNDDGTSTWHYFVEEMPDAQDLSNWVLELPDCVTVVSALPEPNEVVTADENTGLSGIKWETGAGFEAGEFSVTLDAYWTPGLVAVAAKGPDVAEGEITGPTCDEDVDADSDGYTVGEGDCMDDDPAVHPGVAEICGDEVDQDCDGEDLVCPFLISEGVWEGTMDESMDRTIRFTVHDDEVSALTVAVEYTGDCTGGETIETGTATVEIIDNTFSYSSAELEINGTFTSATESSGTWFYNPAGCNGQGGGDWIAGFVEDPADPGDVDEDGDGYTVTAGDCDDTMADIHPGAEEICGNAVDENCDTFTPACAPDGAEILEGRFVFGMITGLSFSTETQYGLTENGVFTYIEGETVTFYLGNIMIGSAQAQPLITPVDLVPGAVDLTSDTIINIARFLLTLDDDGDALNGIFISEAVRLACFYLDVGLMIDFTLTVAEFELDADVEEALYLLTVNRSGGRRLLALLIRATLCLERIDVYVDSDGDGWSEEEGDCDDTDETVYPGVGDCIDPDADLDGDTFSINDGDCDDTDDTVYPGVGDCIDPDADLDGDTFSINDGDCDDTDDTIFPEAEDICGDGIDQDCDGVDPVCTPDMIIAGDWTGTTDQNHEITFSVMDGEVTSLLIFMDYVGDFDPACVLTSKLVLGSAGVEIVEGRFSFSTDNVEVIGTFIDDADGLRCEGTWFYQNDVCDGSGSGTWVATLAEADTDADGDGFTVEQGDCDDSDADIFPGAAEICGDGIDQDCLDDDLVCSDVENEGNLSIYLTAENLDETQYKAVYVTIKEVQVQGTATSGWQVIGEPNRTFALVDLENEITQLAVEDLKAGFGGRYNQIRLIIDDTPDDPAVHPHANYVVDVNDEVFPLKIPSGFRTGIKIKHKFTIINGQSKELLLKFNASASIVGKKDKWKMKPVIKVTEAEGLGDDGSEG